MKAIAPVAPVAVKLINGQPTTTSLDVATHFGKLHKDVLRAIRSLGCSSEFHERNFAPIQIDIDLGVGRTRKDQAYRMTRDGFTFLCMGFTGKEAAKWKEAYIDAFNQLEHAVTEKNNLLAAQEIRYEQRAFRGSQVLVSMMNGKLWLSAGNLCTALNLGSSDRVVRSLGPQHKHKVRRGSRGLWMIDSVGAERAADYCKAELVEEYREWLRRELPQQPAEQPVDVPSFAGRRWLLSFDHSGKEQIRPIPEDAGVMTLREMLSAVSTGDLLLSIQELFQLSAALHHRIEQRTTNQAQQLQELQQRVETGR